jgi:hypothetical protein
MVMPETAKPVRTIGPGEQQILVGELSVRTTRELTA